MPAQKTDKATISTEILLVKDIAGLSSTDGITLNDRGWDSRVYSFGDGRYFFKFPRSEKVQSRYKFEIAALKLLAGTKMDVIIPKILWEHSENKYIGYEGVLGNPVNEVIRSLRVSQKQSIGQALGIFLKQLHSSQLPGARTMGLEDEMKQIQRWYENSKSTISLWFGGAEQDKLHQLVYDIWPAKLLDLGSDQVLSHCDLHFENIFYGHDGAVGIIDFGDVAYCDRSKDFLELENDRTVFESVLNVYEIQSFNLTDKIRLRQAMIQVINLGFHAGKEDDANTALIVKKLKSILNS